MKKKLISIVSLACASALAVSLVGCGKDDDGQKNPVATSYVSLDINPSIELILDGDDNVMSVRGTNEDGQVLLYNEQGIIGEDVDDAVEKITKLAVDMGYLAEDNKVVGTSVSSNSDKNANRILTEINATVKSSANEVGLTVTTNAEGAYSLVRKYEEFKAKYPSNAEIQALTITEFKLAYSASESGEITVEAAVKLDQDKLIQMISEPHDKAEEYTTTAFAKARETAQAIYDVAVGTLEDGLYAKHYLSAQNMPNHLSTCWYGSAYQAYKSLSRGLNGTANAIKYVEDMSSYELSEEQTQSVLTALNLTAEDVDLIKNSDGKVTVESVEAYADKLFKNSESGEALTAIKQELTTALRDVEGQLAVIVKELVEEHEQEITDMLTTAEGIINLIPNIGLTDALTTFKADFSEIVGQMKTAISDGTITSYEVRDIAKVMEEKAAQMLTKIEADLSEEELASVEAEKEKLGAQLATLKATMDNAINEAETTAKARLNELKNQRLQDLPA